MHGWLWVPGRVFTCGNIERRLTNAASRSRFRVIDVIGEPTHPRRARDTPYTGAGQDIGKTTRVVFAGVK
jgi:hypothetical protein